jgi:hypothetical protein
MERGFLLDEAHGRFTVNKWIGGDPEKSIWTGLKTRGWTSWTSAPSAAGAAAISKATPEQRNRALRLTLRKVR